jgi:hypothetical protein
VLRHLLFHKVFILTVTVLFWNITPMTGEGVLYIIIRHYNMSNYLSNKHIPQILVGKIYREVAMLQAQNQAFKFLKHKVILTTWRTVLTWNFHWIIRILMNKFIGSICGEQHIWIFLISITGILSLNSPQRAHYGSPQNQEQHSMSVLSQHNKQIYQPITIK